MLSAFSRDQRKAKGLDYLRKWESKFWISMDENISIPQLWTISNFIDLRVFLKIIKPRLITLERHNWKKEEILQIYNKPLMELLYEAATVHRQFHDPNSVQLSTLLSIKTGGCPDPNGPRRSLPAIGPLPVPRRRPRTKRLPQIH